MYNSTPITDIVRFIQEKNWYFIFISPNVSFNKSPVEIRQKLTKRLLQIQDYCRKHGNIQICVILPERDMDFYAAMFNMADVKTVAVVQVEPDFPCTDYYAVISKQPVKMGVDLPTQIADECSLVVFINCPEVEEDNPLESTVENENQITFDVMPTKRTEIMDGDPSKVLRAIFKPNVRHDGTNPYEMFPSVEQDMVRRIPYTFYDDMLNTKPYHDQPRIQPTG